MVGPPADLRPLNITIRVIPGISEGSPWPRCWSPGREPIPARRSIGGCGLFGVRNEEDAFLGDRVHACAGGEDVSRLGATVQHDDQRERLPLTGVRHIQFVSMGSGMVAVGLGNELSAYRDNVGGLGPKKLAQPFDALEHETPFQYADVGRYQRLLSHWKREIASAQPL
jgi:hypothetical protein